MTPNPAIGKNPMLSLSGYELRNIPYHLNEAGMTAELHRLLGYAAPDGRNAWFQASFSCNNMDKYIEQVNMAWKAAVGAVEFRPEGSDNGIPLSQEVYYALQLAAVNDVATDITPSLLRELVGRGLWSFEQAYALAQRNKKWITRIRLFGALLPWLVKEQNRHAYEFLIQRLDDHWAGFTTRAEIRVKSYDEDDERMDVPHEYAKSGLLQQIIRENGEQLPAAMWSVVRAMRFPWCLTPVVALLAKHSTKAPAGVWDDLLHYTRELLDNIGRPSLRAWTLAQLSDGYSAEEKEKVLIEAWEWMKKTLTGDPREREFELTPLNGMLYLKTASMDHDEAYAEPIMAIASRMSPGLLHQILQDTEHFIPAAKGLVYSYLMPYMRDQGKTYLKDIKGPYYAFIASVTLMKADTTIGQFQQKWTEASAIATPDLTCEAWLALMENFPALVSLDDLDSLVTTMFTLNNQHFSDKVLRRVALLLGRFEAADYVPFIEKWFTSEKNAGKKPSVSYEDGWVVPNVLASYLTTDQLLNWLEEVQLVGGSNAAMDFFARLDRKEKLPEKEMWNEDSISAGNWPPSLTANMKDYIGMLITDSQTKPDGEEIRNSIEAQLAASGAKRRYNDASALVGMEIQAQMARKFQRLGSAIRFVCKNGPVGELGNLDEMIGELKDPFVEARCWCIVAVRMRDDPAGRLALQKALNGAWQTTRSWEGEAIIRFLLDNAITDTRLIHESWAAGLQQRSTDYRSQVFDYLGTTIPLLEKLTKSDPRPVIRQIVEKAQREWGNTSGIQKIGLQEPVRESQVLSPGPEVIQTVMGFGDYLYASMREFMAKGSFSKAIDLYYDISGYLLDTFSDPELSPWLGAIIQNGQISGLARRDPEVFELIASQLQTLKDKSPDDEIPQASLEILSSERRFLDWLVQLDMRFILPDSYTPAPDTGYFGLPSVFVMSIEDGSVEAHYFMQPAADGPLPPLQEVFRHLLKEISNDDRPLREFPEWGVNKEYNADRGGVVNVEVKADHPRIKLPFCEMVVLQASGRGSCCILFFHRERVGHRKYILEAFYSLHFAGQSKKG